MCVGIRQWFLGVTQSRVKIIGLIASTKILLFMISNSLSYFLPNSVAISTITEANLASDAMILQPDTLV